MNPGELPQKAHGWNTYGFDDFIGVEISHFNGQRHFLWKNLKSGASIGYEPGERALYYLAGFLVNSGKQGRRTLLTKVLGREPIRYGNKAAIEVASIVTINQVLGESGAVGELTPRVGKNDDIKIVQYGGDLYVPFSLAQRQRLHELYLNEAEVADLPDPFDYQPLEVLEK